MATMTRSGANQKQRPSPAVSAHKIPGKIVTHAKIRSYFLALKVKILELSNYSRPGYPVRKHQAFLSSAG